MRNFKKYIIVVLILISADVWSQKVVTWAKLDTTAMTIGDQIKLDLGIKVPENYVVEWPKIDDTLNSHFEIVNKSKIDTTVESGKMSMNRQLTVTSFDSGYFELPEFTFKFKPQNDTTVNEAKTESMFIQVNVPEVDTTKPFIAIKEPIAEPYTFAEIWPWVAGGLALAIAIAFLVYYLIQRKKNKPLFTHKPKPLPPPDVEALDKLENLRLAKLWQNGKVKEYYSQMTDIMRRYMERRFEFDAPEMTSDEIIDELKNLKINSEALEKLKGAFSLADLVKFAKAQPTPLENDLSLNHCIDFVNETKPKPVEDNEEQEKQLSDKKEDK